MNAPLAISRYLWTETRLRWRAQPASPLARLLLTFVLAVATGVFLAGFAAAELARRGELQRLGLDTMVLRVPATGALPTEGNWPADHWASSLQTQGDMILLQQLPAPGQTPWGQSVPVLAAPLAEVARLMSGDEARTAGAVWFSRILAPGRQITVTYRGTRHVAVTVAPQGRWRALGMEEFVLLPAGATEGQGPAGRLDVILFTPADEAVAGDAGRQLRGLFQAEQLEAPAIQDPTPVRRALAAFSRGQAQWRTTMVLALGACVLVMFLSLGMLEERQTRFTQALLRSLGVPAGMLWTAALAENLLLANLALMLALAASDAGAAGLLTLAGAGSGAGTSLAFDAIVWLACSVNVGVLLSLLPLGNALRRPVGAVLP